MSKNGLVTVLDFVDGITVPGQPFLEPSNEYWALICLREGMEYLYRRALGCDATVKQRANPNDELKFYAFGNDPAFDGIHKALLTCSFHWYAISACQYVRTVGAIARTIDPNRPLPPDYVKRVIPEVLVFRDKVAAHFAWTTQNNRDNDAERMSSILPPLAFHDGSFHVGSFTVAVRRGNTASNSGDLRPWSLCKVHERLTERYWQNQPRR